MTIFNDRFNIEKKCMEYEVDLIPPSFQLIYEYVIYVVSATKMEEEIPVIALVYLERLLERHGLLVNQNNWRRLCPASLCLASKVWDDDSLENEHFPQVLPDVTLAEVAAFERTFLELVGFELAVRGAHFAKFYFVMRSVAHIKGLQIHLPSLDATRIIAIEE